MENNMNEFMIISGIYMIMVVLLIWLVWYLRKLKRIQNILSLKIKVFKKQKELKNKKETITPKKLEEFNQIEKYLDEKLEKVFKSFIFKSVLFTLRQFSSTISESERALLRIKFLEYLEFNLNDSEKDIFKLMYTFEQFKFKVIDFFNIKLVKLELMVCHRLEIDEKEFSDHKLLNSIYDGFTTKEIKNISDIFKSINKD